MKLRRRNKNRRHPRPAIMRTVEILIDMNENSITVARSFHRALNDVIDAVNAIHIQVAELEKSTVMLRTPERVRKEMN
jgi:N-acetylmuramic acid 6-phosphate (MurNAc-6-P) etherase